MGVGGEQSEYYLGRYAWWSLDGVLEGA